MACARCKEGKDKYCMYCGEQLVGAPFPYTKKAKTDGVKIKEVLEANAGYDKATINRFLSNRRAYERSQCPACGNAENIVGANERRLMGYFEKQQDNMLNSVFDEADIPRHLMRGVYSEDRAVKVCLICGKVWESEDDYTLRDGFKSFFGFD